MARVHEPEWIQGNAIFSHGLRIGFRSNQSDLLNRLQGVFAPGRPIQATQLDFLYSLKSDEAGRVYTAYIGSQRFAQSTDLDVSVAEVESHLQKTIAQYAREHLFVHAGVAGWRGRALLVPGHSYSGKSTLIQALIRAGAVYFSDEFAVLDSQGFVHPFARPLSLRSPGGKVSLKPSDLGAQTASEPFLIGAIAVTRYLPDARWRPVLLSPGKARLELLRNTVAVRSDPARAMRYFRSLPSDCVAFRTLRGGADATGPLLLEMLDRLMKLESKKRSIVNDT